MCLATGLFMTQLTDLSWIAITSPPLGLRHVRWARSFLLPVATWCPCLSSLPNGTTTSAWGAADWTEQGKQFWGGKNQQKTQSRLLIRWTKLDSFIDLVHGKTPSTTEPTETGRGPLRYRVRDTCCGIKCRSIAAKHLTLSLIFCFQGEVV